MDIKKTSHGFQPADGLKDTLKNELVESLNLRGEKCQTKQRQKKTK